MPRMGTEERTRRDAVIMRLFVAGWSYREIARHPNVDLAHQTVAQIVHAELQKSGRTAFTEQVGTIYLERLETLLRASWPQAINGDLRAIEVVRRVLAQEARFYGLER
ncbi:hypothetical protein [Mycobacteroides abscessus]|uniref:hypothetical protein n=2 Tax=Mycobacteroides abscessus TaxID=36809 RepID=UPI000268287F|nr:hypothetical protein [Mycobacteroides abscessus]EIU63236.1 hypothetical protein MM1S1510930_3577 [Mycobacteroides abscessus subsp. bolletii 1S-151-0930]MBE5481578.1 hypothetical protein [Mycobacteroides abscessus]MDM2161979.1 hypothetical protein [Mycobacteroides abscessus]QOF34485.1 hypothetical protein E3G57_003401 [Mycobacteroides abscessus]SKI85071.1 Uncharacterised protein [Mycobacteroides abscessus subsp. massiliense]